MADDQVTAVKQANDIVDVVGEYVALRRPGRTFKGLCPFHDDHNPSLDVDPTRQRFRCWVCGKFGDVITFIQERERVDFREALELLARRANIPLKNTSPAEAQGRARMFDLMKWAEEQYHRHFLESPAADEARKYVEERHLSGETVKRYGIGYAPNSFEWLTTRGVKAKWPVELLVKVGLVGQRDSDGACYDRFRDRVIFPIRDVRGRTVGLGGRILPSSSSSATAPKYYNSSDTPLFTKSEHLYGLDQARQAGEKEGFLAVVEGYTDVLMAHQLGVLNVVATLGTALNVRHIQQLRRHVPKVVLVFDADAGGERGVDQALELFVSQDVDLAVATLPDGLDPCDLLVQRGAEPFKEVLRGAVDALEFKLNRVFTVERTATVEGKRQAVDAVLEVLALAPDMPGKAGLLKRELIVSRIAQRVGIREELIWERLRELRREKKRPATAERPAEQVRASPADPAERQLLEVLLAEPLLIRKAHAAVSPEELTHPGLRRMLTELYALSAAGESPSADALRARLDDNPALADKVLDLEARGRSSRQTLVWLDDLLEAFRRRREAAQAGAVKDQLRTVPTDGPVPLELLKRLQESGERPA